MKTLVSKLHNFWFSPAPAERLAILRIATGGFALWYLTSRFSMMEKIAASDVSMFQPVGIIHWLNAPLTPSLFTFTLMIGVGLNLAYITGWKYKWTGPFFALLLLFILSYRNSWSMIYHNRIALVLHVFVIGLVSAADTISIDAWNKNKSVITQNLPHHWRYGWPIKLICTATVITYFLSGLAKVFGELAWDWVNGEAMRSQVAVDAIRKDMFGEMVSPFFEWLYPHTELFLIMGMLTFILELGAPMAILNKRIGMLWAILTWSMHWGIYFIMGIRFRYQMTGIIFLPFFDLEKVVHHLEHKLSGKNQTSPPELSTQNATSVVLFDGICNLCDSTVRFIHKNDKNNYFQFTSLQSETGQKLLKDHNVTSNLSTIVLINDDGVYYRSAAILHIMRRLKLPWRWLYFLIWVPKPIRESAYKMFARNRYQWFGTKDSCELPLPGVSTRFL